jgi:hypothetical protein
MRQWQLIVDEIKVATLFLLLSDEHVRRRPAVLLPIRGN